MDGYDITAARGFIDLYSLPMQVRGVRQKVKKSPRPFGPVVARQPTKPHR